ncbi:MAG: sigma-70 family RNA polymerase sigma factor [Candidatus Poribacteria bacterium]|nr:sigma-70 family RNA polymerase sigma factor [Candidatus Poribacteria bacterium]
MKNDDTQLIQRVLDGDDTAFSALVRKYQRSVHALAWRKIGDFHIAEDITQDTFLKAYQRLSTLKKPQRFASWLYVIAANHCSTWLRKKRLWTQSLEETNSAQLEKATYSGYVIEENERTTAEAQREVVKKLLAKLKESDRTVITLYYLGGMTYEEISEFLGVSVAAIKNRLYRARRRLKEEEPMIREALGNFQITPHLTENIMQKISRLKPVTPSGSKPLIPWAIGGSVLVVAFLMLGVGNQYLSRFQKPYSFNATSEMTVELIEAPIVLNLDFKPDVRTQLGNANAPNNSDGLNQQPDPPTYMARFAAAPVDETEEVTVADEAESDIILIVNTTAEGGGHLAEGTFNLRNTDEALTSTTYSTSGGSGGVDPSPRYMLFSYVNHKGIELFRFPLSIGNTWTQIGRLGRWYIRAETSLENYEQVEVSAGTFRECLRHKTIFTDVEADSELESALANGTRYLWFAKGVGIVKMRYEHTNGIVTEAELLEYKVPANTTEYFPLQIDNTWSYKWQNNYRDKAAIETCYVVNSSAVSRQQDTTPPKVEKTIPNLSEKISTDLKEIRIVFDERMRGIDVAFAGVPVGDIWWEDGNTTLVISFKQHLASSKIYRLILGVDGNIKDIAGNPLDEHTLIFTTEGSEPVTPTFVNMTPVPVTDIEELNLSNELLCRVSTDLTDGFAFPYYLFIPQGIDSNKPIHLLVEPCNTGSGNNFKKLDRKVKAFTEASHATVIARKLKIPLLVPVFPRPGGDQWQLYTHALDRDTLLLTEGGLRRIDLQLIKMIDHAQRLLRHNNVKINKKVFMNGFSASGTFTNRFAILHPTVVRAVATGGVNGIPTFPTDRWNEVTIRYPIGIADVKEIAGIEFDEAAYKKVSQYIYMGALDDNDTIPYRDAFDEVDAELVKSLIGAEMMPDRWEVSQSIYKALEIPAQFVTYENTGHQIKSEMIDDIVAFFKANSGDEIVKIVSYQYPSSSGE